MNNNPYIGPRPYQRGERRNFYGRSREARDLLSLVKAERVVLFYAQSGAGKTSLLNAQIIPALEDEGFHVLPVARVGSDLPPGIDPKAASNIFVFSALMGLAGESLTAEALLHHTLLSFLRQVAQTSEAPQDQGGLEGKPPILILDQFEEILTTHRERWQDARGFFEQLQEALREMPGLGVVLAMREDHVAGLDSYAALLPRRLRARFRMELMRREAALEAVRRPAQDAGCPFGAGVAERLVDDLSRIQTTSALTLPRATGEGKTVLGPYIEPVQLQVVCQRLWENLPEQSDHLIQWEEVEQYGNIDRALIDFYESALSLAKVPEPSQGRVVSERQLRHWFSEQLITPMQTRGLVLRGQDETAGLPNAAVDVLEQRHLIRADVRAGARWYELIHDRMVSPILQSNRAWEAARQTPLRTTAQRWQETRNISLLYQDKTLKETLAWAQANPGEIEPYEQEFLKVSQEAERVRNRTRRLMVGGLVGLAVGLIVMVMLSVAAFRGQQEARQAQATAVVEANVRGTAQAQAEAQRQAAEAARATAVAESRVRATAQAQAVEQRQIAVARQLAAQASRYATEKQTDLALLLSLEANRITDAMWARGNLMEVKQANKSLLTFLRGHTDQVRSVAYSPDGKLLASAGKDKIIRLWDVSAALDPSVASRQPMGQPLTGHSLEVSSVAFSPDGKLLASGGLDGKIILWDVSAALGAGGATQPISQLLTSQAGPVSSVAFSPAPLGGASGELLAAGSADNTITLWDVETRQPRGPANGRLTGHTKGVMSVAFSPDGKMLASGSEDSTVRLWDAATGRPLGQLLVDHEQMVSCVVFSPDGKLLASGNDTTVQLWDVATGQPHGPDEGRLTGHNGMVWSLAFSLDVEVLASGSDDNTIILWDVKTGRQIGQLAGHKDSVDGLAFSPAPLPSGAGGLLLASTGRDQTIILWNVATGGWACPAMACLTDHTGFIDSVIFSPDGQTLISASEDATILLWDVPTALDIRSAIGQPRSPVKGRLTGHTGTVRSVALSPAPPGGGTGGKLLASASADETIILWDMATGQPRGEPLTGHTGSVNSVAFSPDGKWLASGSEDMTVMVWDVATGQPRVKLVSDDTKEIDSVAFSPDGKTLVFGSRDNAVCLWDVSTALNAGEMTEQSLDAAQACHTEHTGPVYSVAFSPASPGGGTGGKLLASGSGDHNIILRDAVTGLPFGQPLTGHTNEVNSVAFSPAPPGGGTGGKLLASASNDKTVRLWDVATGQLVGQPFTGHSTEVRDVAFSPAPPGGGTGGKLLVSAGADGTLLFWNVDFESLLPDACWIANRNLTRQEWKQYMGDEPYHLTCPAQGAPPEK